MSLLADIEGHVHRKGPRCSVAVLLRSMTEPDRTDLAAALIREQLASSDIWRALRKRGIEITKETIARHRRGDCLCR